MFNGSRALAYDVFMYVSLLYERLGAFSNERHTNSYAGGATTAKLASHEATVRRNFPVSPSCSQKNLIFIWS